MNPQGSFIDLRLTLRLAEGDAGPTVSATTIARYNDWWGRLYFIPVRYGHRIVLADTMRRLALLLEDDRPRVNP